MKTIEEAAHEYADDKNMNIAGSRVIETFKAGVQFAKRWIPVEEELPEKQNPVIVKIRNKRSGTEYKTMAYYIHEKSVSAEYFLNDDALDTLSEYDEETDEFYTKAGWYEYQTVSETHFYIDDEVISWKPIEIK